MDTTRTYWRLGDGDPYNAGGFGFDNVATIDDVAVVVGTSRPDGAVDSTENEHDRLRDAWATEWEKRAEGGQRFVDAAIADDRAIRESAKKKLVSGKPLTAAEAARLIGA